jgi:hypothetical protein
LLFILDTGVRASEMARYNLEQYRFWKGNCKNRKSIYES